MQIKVCHLLLTPSQPSNARASNLVWSSSLHVPLSLELKHLHNVQNAILLSPDISEFEFPQ